MKILSSCSLYEDFLLTKGYCNTPLETGGEMPSKVDETWNVNKDIATTSLVFYLSITLNMEPSTIS